MKTLFKNCYILIRNDNGYETLENSYLGVEKDKIIYIGKEEPNDYYDIVKDMTNKLLMPGLINAHGHSPMTLLRGVGSGLNLQTWLFDTIFPIEDKMNPNDIEAGCRLGIMEMLKGGTTCFSEMYDFPFASMKAIAETGIKANINRVGMCFNQEVEMKDFPRYSEIEIIPDVISGKLKTCPEMEKELRVNELPRIIKNAFNDDKIKYDFCIHAEYSTSPKMVDAIANLNKKYNLCLNIHLSETKKEMDDCLAKRNQTPLQYFKEHGLLDSKKVYAAHCVHVTDEDLDIMKEYNVTLVHNPSSNLKLGSGIAPIVKALNKGINVALGTDGCASNNNLDMFEEMHLAALLQTGVNMDPTLMQVNDVIDMATINGAKALGRFDTGKLEVGYKADIIAINLNAPHLFPINDMPSLIVYSMQASDVCLTMVDGKTLYENGVFYTLNAERAYKDAKKAVERLLK